MTTVVLLTVAVVLVVVCALALARRRGPRDDAHRGLLGNDPAPPGTDTGADARGAVNKHSWMLGGGGSGG